MVIRIFVLSLLILATFSYFIPVDRVDKKESIEDMPLLVFDNSIMYTLSPQNMNRIVYSKKAIRYKTKDVLLNGSLTTRNKNSNGDIITDTLLADKIVKRADKFKFLNNVKFTRNDYINLNTDELDYNAKTKIAFNSKPFDGNYYENYINGENIYLDLNKYYMSAKHTHFEIDTNKGN